MRASARVLLLSVLFGVLGLPTASAQLRLAAESGSTVWIEGTSSVNRFTCSTQTVDGYGLLSRAQGPVRPATGPPGSTPDTHAAYVELAIPVASLDCGRDRMNRDLTEAMQADAYPFIYYRLDAAHAEGGTVGDGLRVTAHGRLTIAGTTRPFELTVLAERLGDGHYRARGHQTVAMSDFGIDPPSALLGLVQVHDEIVVRFDVVATSNRVPAAD